MVFAVSDGPILASRANDFDLLQERCLVPEKSELLDLSVGIELNDVDLHQSVCCEFVTDCIEKVGIRRGR